MSEFDPFDDAEAQDEAPGIFSEEPEEAPPVKKAPAKKAAPKKETALTDNNTEGKLTITLKGGAGFDAPWIVIHAADVADATGLVSDEAALADLMRLTQKAASFFSGLGSSKPAGAPARPGSEPPAGTPAAPGPDWTYKTGVGKNGKTWKAWMPPRDSDEKPVWL